MSYTLLNNETPAEFKALATENLAIKGARLIDPAEGFDEITDLVIKDGKIAAIGAIPKGFSGDAIEAAGWIVCPGLFDMHVHFREPGYEYKETIQTGCNAAVAGGFTGVATMPNTNPATDNPALVKLQREKAEGTPVEVVPIAAVTKERKGETLAEMAELHEAGVNAFSDDGSPVFNAEIMRLAIEYTRMFDGVIIEHCEDSQLSGKGIMDEGALSTSLGLAGWPSVAEDIDAYRAIRLAEYTGGRAHIAHVSTLETVELIRDAKARGVRVTAEVTVQHLTLDSSVMTSYDSDYKVNPPLRTPDDVRALIEGVVDGTIDAIVTDHAPHAPDEKDVELMLAPFGMIGLETALGVVLTKLVAENKISLRRVLETMSEAPRRILGLNSAKIKPGYEANLTMFDPEKEWTVDRDKFQSKAKNTPFNGWQLKGAACGVINKGIAWIRQD